VLNVCVVVVVVVAVVLLVTGVVYVSDAAVVRSGRPVVCRVQLVSAAVRITCPCATRVDERSSVSAFDEVTASVDFRQQTLKPLVQRVVAIWQ